MRASRETKKKLLCNLCGRAAGVGQDKQRRAEQEEEREEDEEAKELELQRAEEEAEAEEGRAGLYGMLLQLCSELHKHLRPRVFHGTDMDTLCEVKQRFLCECGRALVCFPAAHGRCTPT